MLCLWVFFFFIIVNIFTKYYEWKKRYKVMFINVILLMAFLGEIWIHKYNFGAKSTKILKDLKCYLLEDNSLGILNILFIW